ncbi:sortase [Candidatus Saccharibacteria bacterium]|nr:sortase [Candidatus Saccharibacteria bacterium]
MPEKNFFGLSRGHYDPLANAMPRPLVVPERPATTALSTSPARQVQTRQIIMDVTVKPKSPPKAVLKPAPKPLSPALPIDDLLSDFIEKKPRAKKLGRVKTKTKKPRQKLTQRLLARRRAKVERKKKSTTPTKSRAKEIATKPSAIKNADFTTQALTVAAGATDATVQTPTALAWNGGAATLTSEPENVLGQLHQIPRISFEFKMNKKRVFAFARAIVVGTILAVSSYLAWDLWLADQAAREAFSNPVAAVMIDEVIPSGADVTSIGSQAWVAHVMPADQARYLYLPTINTQARVMSVGINSKGKIDATKNVNDVAWYDGSAKPGQEGQVFINGQASFAPTYKAAFDRLAELQIDDRIIIERGDGKKITYRVVSIETIGTDEVNMKKVLNVPDEAIRGLTLMGCTGKFNYRTESSDTRVIVYAVQE